jgi:hypothetical protein
VLDSGIYILGVEVESFENAFAQSVERIDVIPRYSPEDRGDFSPTFGAAVFCNHIDFTLKLILQSDLGSRNSISPSANLVTPDNLRKSQVASVI